MEINEVVSFGKVIQSRLTIHLQTQTNDLAGSIVQRASPHSIKIQAGDGLGAPEERRIADGCVRDFLRQKVNRTFGQSKHNLLLGLGVRPVITGFTLRWV